MNANLALFGHPPAFPNVLHVGTPNLGDVDRFQNLVGQAFDRRWFSNFGPIHDEFEKKIRGLIGAKYCLPVCNATIGLELVLQALDLKGEVILPSFTFIATAHAVKRSGFVPVFCDVNPVTHMISPSEIQKLINQRTSAILGVHLWGQTCQVMEIEQIAKSAALPVIYDAAHAFGVDVAGQSIADFGEAQVFSFHSTKFINAFEGGAIATHSKELYERLRLMANFGFAGYDRVEFLGTNAKMNEISAAMGLATLEKMEEIISVNRANLDLYKKLFSDIPGISFLKPDESSRSNFQYVVGIINPQQLGLTRDQLLEVLWAENVRVRRYFYPGCHRMEPYKSGCDDPSARLPVTRDLCEKVLVFPTGMTVNGETISRIVEIVRNATQKDVIESVKDALASRQSTFLK